MIFFKHFLSKKSRGEKKHEKNFQLRPELIFYTKTKLYGDGMNYRNNSPR